MLEVNEDADELKLHPLRLYPHVKFFVENAPTTEAVAAKAASVKREKAAPLEEAASEQRAANAPRRRDTSFQCPIRLANETNNLKRNQLVTLSSKASAFPIEEFWCRCLHHSARVAFTYV